MYVVVSDGEVIAITNKPDYARIISAQEKRDYPDKTVTYGRESMDSNLNQIAEQHIEKEQ